MSDSSTDQRPWLRRPEAGFLDVGQTATLDVLLNAILPGDHTRQIPSAVEAGASAFISQLLAMDATVYDEIPAWQALYSKAIGALDAYAATAYGKPLSALTLEQATLLMSGMQSGSLVGLPADLDQKLVFTTLRRHCIQGCFADPRWGGNKANIMWRALGYLQPAEDLYP